MYKRILLGDDGAGGIWIHGYRGTSVQTLLGVNIFIKKKKNKSMFSAGVECLIQNNINNNKKIQQKIHI